ncbi:MAG: hypothetical protein LC104_17675 [Bacteroidales bacterium]|nr:hypothetical protein [Bacteroidales bacterium]
MEFEWDNIKATTNKQKQKHGVTFAEAATAFADTLAAIFSDYPEYFTTESGTISQLKE